jgi:hypothetical protein
MKFFSVIIIIGLLCFASGFIFPWWAIAPLSFMVTLLIPQKPGISFLSAFLALFILWGGLASYMDVKNKHILSTKIAELFFDSKSNYLIIFVTALAGGLVTGFSALTASLLRPRPKTKTINKTTE